MFIKHTCLRVSLGVLVSFGIATSADGALSHFVTTAPGGFAQAGASDIDSTNGGGIIPGADLQVMFGAAGADFDEQAFAGTGSATASATFNSGSIVNSASAFAQLKRVKLQAANTNGTLSGSFPGGRAHGGYRETLTVVPNNNPSLIGQPGFYVFDVHVTGTLMATGANGRATVSTAVYKDGAPDLGQNLFWDPGNSDPIATDRQRAFWGVSTFAPGEVATKPVNDTITMSVPIVFGTPFDLAFYVYGTASTRSQASAAGGSTADMMFQNSFDYGGIVGVYAGANPDPINDLLAESAYTVDSASGVDWTVPIPEPTSLALLGLGALAIARRR